MNAPDPSTSRRLGVDLAFGAVGAAYLCVLVFAWLPAGEAAHKFATSLRDAGFFTKDLLAPALGFVAIGSALVIVPALLSLIKLRNTRYLIPTAFLWIAGILGLIFDCVIGLVLVLSIGTSHLTSADGQVLLYYLAGLWLPFGIWVYANLIYILLALLRRRRKRSSKVRQTLLMISLIPIPIAIAAAWLCSLSLELKK